VKRDPAAAGDLRRALAYLRPHGRSFALAMTLVLPITLLELLKPWPLKLVLDNVIPGVRWPPLERLEPAGLLMAALAVLVAIHLLLGVFGVVHNIVTIRIGQRMVNDLRAELFDRLQRLSLRFHSRGAVGDLIHRVTLDSFSIQTLAMNGVFPLVGSSLLLVGMFVVMVQLSWHLTLVALVVCPLLFAGIAVLDGRIVALASEARAREGDVYTRAQRGLSAIRVVQAFAMEGREQRAFLATSTASLDSSRRLYTLQSVYTAAVGVILALGTALVLWFGVRGVWGAHVSVGDLIVFVSYLGSLYGPLNSILQTYGLAANARAGLRRVFEVLDSADEVADGFRVPEAVRGHVTFDDASFSYDGTRLALKHVSFDARPGELLAIVGESGAGKSTLLNLLPRFADVTEGRVCIDGIDVREWRLRELRRAITMVLQPPIVFPLSIAENIAYGRPEASLAEIEAAARLARAHEFVARLPQGYDTVLGEQGATLSEGERQRLTLARALLRDAPILILDEPTSAVDLETEALILDAIGTLSRGRTTFVIAHRLATVRRADRILVLRDGELIEEGSYEELVGRGGAFARLHAAQFGEGGTP
jgi:ATP-binding cassette subfamily B protein/subfamily B ATP-binding cassette protein MsbA